MRLRTGYSLLVFLLVPILSILMFLPETGYAQTCDDWIARIVSVQGAVFAQKPGKEEKMSVKLNETFSAGDTLFIGPNSRLGVYLCNQSVLRLDQNTTITFSGIEKRQTTVFQMIRGVVQFFSRTPRGLTVATPFVNGSVEGTEFLVKVDPEREETLMSVFEGRVLAENAAGSLLLESGRSAVTRKGEAPQTVVVVRPRDAVQWALYYPPVLSYRENDFPGDTGWEKMLRASIENYRAGDLVQAFSSLEKAPKGIRDPRFYTYRAGLLLTVGRVDQALTDIQKALALDPANSDALSLQAVIAVAQNDKAKALELSERAAASDPRSSTARVALSYAQQAHFDIEGALKSIEEAVRLDGENAFAWSRLSELWLSLGHLDKSLAAAKTAVSLNPNVSGTQSVLGFAHLTRIDIREAKEAFEKAILLNQAAPLPRLGLGLAKIREGDLNEGRREIEIAAALDPNSSLIRSYLGKAYYEEKRDPLDKRQFEIAKELDPMDPTPYFYDAIRLQSVNRPVEALQNLQKSIALNDNRAVYRSRLLLDDDLAARSAALGQIYRDLGFEQLALVEGWKSVNTDPGNYSAHRLLADTYSVLPRHEIARVSELLRSQLLQPINITPVQPQLAESDLFILQGAGPTDAAFNEFNALFNRNRASLLASGVAGGNETLGDELVVSGVYDRYSVSLGQFHYETEGFRQNNDLDQDIYNAFAQVSLSPKTSIQAEYRYFEQDNGDLLLRFDPTNFLRTRRDEVERSTFRAGLRHSFLPNLDFIGSFMYEDADGGFKVPPFIEVASQNDGYIGEGQLLYNRKYSNLVFGGGYFESEESSQPRFRGRALTPVEQDVYHGNAYIYADIKYPQNVIWTVGGSGDFVDNPPIDTDQFNPKFGVIWDVLPSTTFRAAVFRVLRRTLINEQTIEPTQVAGFNQFFDDVAGTDSWRYGIGLDQEIDFSNKKLLRNLFAGVEISRRELDRPIQDTSLGGIVRHVDDDEILGRVYIFWAPHQWFSFGAEYQYEKFDRDSAFPGEADVTELETDRFPLKLNFFHPSGLIAGLTATYVDQDGRFGNTRVGGIRPGSDQFWVLDASLGYRLPKRFGILSIEAKNLLDEELKFQDTDPSNPRIYPERYILGRVTLSF